MARLSSVPNSFVRQRSMSASRMSMDATDASSSTRPSEAPSTTPPTSASESEPVEEEKPEEEPTEHRRASTRVRKSIVATYNLATLVGTNCHTPTKYLKRNKEKELGGEEGVVTEGETLIEPAQCSTDSVDTAAAGEADMDEDTQTEVKAERAPKRRKSTRVDLLTTVAVNAVKVGKRTREAVEGGMEKTKHALACHSEEEPVNKRSKAAKLDSEEPVQNAKLQKKGLHKKNWDKCGIYLGQDPVDKANKTPAQNAARRAALFDPKDPRRRKYLPMPMFVGEGYLNIPYGTMPFKLPFDIFNPLMDRQSKPEDYGKTSKNVFVGDAAQYWEDEWKRLEQSTCQCKPQDGCGDKCTNRSMMYECDDRNCRIGREHCTNRSFADLAERINKAKQAKLKDKATDAEKPKGRTITSSGAKFHIGVEVFETEHTGFGVRANRTFEPNQIIAEYTGEIITHEECNRRMRNEYKNNDCHYFMDFEQQMVVDATKRGSIARFVNHSCDPNCRFEKWTVNGKPRMALFAGEDGVLTGDELTYDYNFSPFSDENVQECKCGSFNCRGFLGPRPKDLPKPKTEGQKTKNPVKAKIAAAVAKVADAPAKIMTKTKRKIQEVFDESETDEERDTKKKQRLATARSAVRSTFKKAKDTITTSHVAKALEDRSERTNSRSERVQRRRSAENASPELDSKEPSGALVKSSLSGLVKAKSPAPDRATQQARPGVGLRPGQSSLFDFFKPHNIASTVNAAYEKGKGALSLPRSKSKGTSTTETAPALPEFEFETNPAASSASLLAPLPPPRPKTSVRPGTSASIRTTASSVKQNVVRSVRGARHTAAVARMGFNADALGVSGATIRVIMGDVEA